MEVKKSVRLVSLVATALVAQAAIAGTKSVIWPRSLAELELQIQGQATAAPGVVKAIIVKGNQIETTQGIIATMRTKVGSPFTQENLDADQQALYNLGVFKVQPLLTTETNADGSITVTVTVVENPIVKEIRVVGNTAVKTAEIMKVVTIKPGQIFNNREARISADNIAKLYEQKGYFAQVADIGYVPESPNTLNIQVQEMVVSAVNITGNPRTKKRVFDHLIKTRAGTPYSKYKWRDDMTRLFNTGWYEKVDPRIDPSPDFTSVALGVGVTEGRSGKFDLGIQADPQSSFAGFVHFTENNLGGTGQGVGASFLQSINGGGASIDTNYFNPFIDSKDTSVNLSLYSHIVYRFAGTLFGGNSLPTNATQYYERHTGGSVNFGRPIGEKQRLTFGTTIEGVNTNNLDTSTTTQFIQQDGTIAKISLGYERDRRDVVLDASRGDFLTLTAEPGYSNITKVGGLVTNDSYLGASNFLKLSGDYRAYFSPGKRRDLNALDAPRHVFAFRVRAGTIMGKVPFFEQYFAGGADTVRGYAESRFWGKQTLIFTGEYRYPIQKGFSLIAFVDYGGAWGGYGTINDFYQLQGFRMHLGYGPGISFKTPLGPIRLDVGFGEKGQTRTDFIIGTSF